MIEDQFITAGGFRTRYLVLGDGAPVMFVHGGGAGADARGNWEHLLPEFANNGWKAIAVDMMGFGENEKPDPSHFEYSQAARVEHLLSFADALGLETFSLIGNSMGGAVSIGAVLSQPERVDKLVLMGSAGLKAEIPRIAIEVLAGYDFSQEGMRLIMDALTGPDYNASDEVVAYRHELATRQDTKAAYGATMQWLRENPFFYADEEIRSISAPTLIVHGKDDQMVDVSLAYRFLELMPNSWGYILPRCGHWAMLEKPREFATATLNFLSNAN